MTWTGSRKRSRRSIHGSLLLAGLGTALSRGRIVRGETITRHSPEKKSRKASPLPGKTVTARMASTKMTKRLMTESMELGKDLEEAMAQDRTKMAPEATMVAAVRQPRDLLPTNRCLSNRDLLSRRHPIL